MDICRRGEKFFFHSGTIAVKYLGKWGEEGGGREGWGEGEGGGRGGGRGRGGERGRILLTSLSASNRDTLETEGYVLISEV